MDALKVQISKTSNGLTNYLQITSSDQVSLNIVLLADTITVEDRRDGSK